MKKIEQVIRSADAVTDIVCDRCKQSCKREMNYEHANITAYWGYESRKDEQVFDLDLCEDCFDILMRWVNGSSLCRGISA